MWLEKTHLLVHGMSVSASCFAVWSGKSARVYRVGSSLTLSSLTLSSLTLFSLAL